MDNEPSWDDQSVAGAGASHRGYSSWEQVSGYFDGDGGLRITIGQFTIQILIVWSETNHEQLEHIAEFLMRRRILPEGPYLRRGKGKSNDAYMLAISVEGGALVALKTMLPHVDKKRGQVQAAIDYLEDKITGDESIARINAEVERKKGVHLEGPSCQEDRGSLTRRVRDCRSGPLWQRPMCD